MGKRKILANCVAPGFIQTDMTDAMLEKARENARKTGQWASTVEELRAAQGIYRILTPDEAVDHIRARGIWVTHPLCGGIPPDLAWPFLEALTDRVLPRVHPTESETSSV